MHLYRSGGFPGGSAYLFWRCCSKCGERALFMLGDNKPCQACATRADAQRRRYERRKTQTVGSRYDFDAIAERDNWTCHICGKRVDPAAHRRSPAGASIDHLVPVACGGGDDPENVALAHLRCNIKRHTGGEVQLRLVG